MSKLHTSVDDPDFMLRLAQNLTVLLLAAFLLYKGENSFGGLKSATEEMNIQSITQSTQQDQSLSAEEMMDAILSQGSQQTTSKSTSDSSISLSYEDAQILMTIAQAEAGIDGVEGMAAVMMTVLNRVQDPNFPDTVEEVVFQTHQFSPISDGRYYSTSITSEAHIALAEVEKGTYSYLNEALFFENAENSWQQNSDSIVYLYTIGHHRFYGLR